jgi:hypothetical protein
VSSEVSKYQVFNPFNSPKQNPLGKPHPRWADSNFRDGDSAEKWHSRATKCMPAQKRGSQPQPQPQPQQNGQHTTDSGGGGGGGGGGDLRNGVSTRGMQSLLSPIKSEPTTDGNTNAHLYRFSPSPAPSMRYHSFQQAEVRAVPDSQTPSAFPATNGATTNGYHQSTNSTGSHYSGNLIFLEIITGPDSHTQKTELPEPTLTMANQVLEPMTIIIFDIVLVGRTQPWVSPTFPSPKHCKALSTLYANSHIILPTRSVYFYGES